MHKHILIKGLLFFSVSLSFCQKNTSLYFQDKIIKFEKVEEGELLEFEFPFTNKGNESVVFLDYKTTCTCTRTIFPKEPIQPNAAGKIIVIFNTNNKIGYQQREVEIITSKGNYTLVFKGIVKATKETKEEFRKGKKVSAN
jgi:hypothetical protein